MNGRAMTMKLTKKLMMLLTTMLLFAGIVAGSCLVASAANVTYPKKIRVYPESTYPTLTIELANAKDEVKNVKSSSKNLKVVRVQEVSTNQSWDYETETYKEEHEYRYVLYSKKNGKYTVKFDVVGADGTNTSHSVTVFVKNDPAVKSITFGGKNLGVATSNSGKLKVVMNKGYKLKKIRVGKFKRIENPDTNYKVRTEMVYTDIKNGSKVTLSKVPEEEIYDYEYTGYDGVSFTHRNTKDVTAPTYFEVTYIDKWTKEEAVTMYYLTRVLI